ncbi:hypothetical protein [Parasphingorhabdus sp.]|uniref:hypothetical protein n=1 Tax=Parasphingorhabdus sp. TaxID=2709688 RepID=UPI003D2BB190
MADTNGQIDISRVLNNTFGVIGRNPVIFLGLSLLIVGIPNLIVQLAQGDPAASLAILDSPAAIFEGVSGFFLSIFFSVVLQATLIVATLNDLAGKPINLGHCIKTAIRKFLPLIGMSILVSVGIGFGMILLIVPGIILALMWLVATPVMMAENKGIFASLKRSAQLTSGSKMILFILLIGFIIVAIIIGLIGNMLSFWSAFMIAIVGALVNTAIGAIQGAGVASIYIDLRTAKEGADTGSLADVFA